MLESGEIIQGHWLTVVILFSLCSLDIKKKKKKHVSFHFTDIFSWQMDSSELPEDHCGLFMSLTEG